VVQKVATIAKSRAKELSHQACARCNIMSDGQIGAGRIAKFVTQYTLTNSAAGDACMLIVPWLDDHCVVTNATVWAGGTWAAGGDMANKAGIESNCRKARVAMMVVDIEGLAGSNDAFSQYMMGIIGDDKSTSSITSWDTLGAMNQHDGSPFEMGTFGFDYKNSIIWRPTVAADMIPRLPTINNALGNSYSDTSTAGTRVVIASKGANSAAVARVTVTAWLEYEVTPSLSDFVLPKIVFENPQLASLQKSLGKRLAGLKNMDGSRLELLLEKLDGVVAKAIGEIGLDDIGKLILNISTNPAVLALFI